MTPEEYLKRSARTGHRGYNYEAQAPQQLAIDPGPDMVVNWVGKTRVQIAMIPRPEELVASSELTGAVAAVPLSITASLYGEPNAYDFTQYSIHIDATGGNLSDGRYRYEVKVNESSAVKAAMSVLNGAFEIPDFTAQSSWVFAESMDVELVLSEHPDLQGVDVSATTTIGFHDWDASYLVNNLTTFPATVGGRTSSGSFSATDTTGPSNYSSLWVPFGVAGALLTGPNDFCAFSFDKDTGKVKRVDFQSFFGLSLPKFLIRQ